MTTNNQKLRSNIKKYYLFRVLSGMFFSVPVMVLFWQENGLSLMQVMYLQSIFAILAVALEIPSGYCADLFGRKKTLLASSVAGMFAMLTYSLGNSFSHFLVAEVLFAFAVSFASGTTSALIFDTLVDLGEEQRYKKIWGHSLFVGMLALAFANSLGGMMAKVDLRLTLYATLPFYAMLVPLVWTMHEPTRHRCVVEKGYAHELIHILRVSIFRNRALRWIIVYSGVIFAFNQSVLWFYQPYFELTGLDVAYFGFVFAAFQIVAAFSSKYADGIERRLGQKSSLVMLTFLVGGSYLLMSHYVALFSFTFCFVQQFVRGFRNTVVTDYVNQLTDSSMRATILSVESFVGRLVYATIIPVFGWIADVYTIGQALTVMGVTTLICGTAVLLLLLKGCCPQWVGGSMHGRLLGHRSVGRRQ